MTPLGLGLGWRPQLAALVLRRRDLGFVEILAEAFPHGRPLPLPLIEARRRGLAVVPHGVGLGLGGAEAPDPLRLEHLAGLAEQVGAPLVSEHVAFVRAGGREAGHLLPVPRSRAALEVLVENVRIASAALPVPLALEPIASLVEWPEPELDEGEFLTELAERTGALLLLDVANIYANARNHGHDPIRLLDRLPLERIAYVHLAGGSVRDGVYHDTHADALPPAVLELLAALCSRTTVPGAMLERDDRFPPAPAIDAELDAISAASTSWAPLPLPRADGGHATRPGLSATRHALAADQHHLLAALVDQAPLPRGVDPVRAAVAATALGSKRARHHGERSDGGCLDEHAGRVADHAPNTLPAGEQGGTTFPSR